MFHFLEKSCFWLKDFESPCGDVIYLGYSVLVEGLGLALNARCSADSSCIVAIGAMGTSPAHRLHIPDS